jgi:hypothetical protein
LDKAALQLKRRRPIGGIHVGPDRDRNLVTDEVHDWQGWPLLSDASPSGQRQLKDETADPIRDDEDVIAGELSRRGVPELVNCDVGFKCSIAAVTRDPNLKAVRKPKAVAGKPKKTITKRSTGKT